MDLLQLKYFCHAASTQNFAKTAMSFQVPASNISNCIRRLEAELEKPLFDRAANRVKLNRHGEIFYERIKEALDLIDSAKSALDDEPASGVIKIGFSMNRHIVVNAIHNFHDQYPKVDVASFKFGEKSHPEDYDLIVTDRVLKTERFVREHVLHDKIVLVTKKGLLKQGSIATAEEMRTLSYITIARGSLMYRDTVNISKHLGFAPHIIMESESSFYIPTCVMQGIGVALVPIKAWLWCLPSESFDIKEIGDFFRDTYVYRKRERYTPAIVERFYEILLEEYNDEMERYQEAKAARGMTYDFL